MWKDIILSIGAAVGEALCFNQIDEKKRQKYSTKLERILQDLLQDFSDTSLDCIDFHSYIQSSAFKQHMQSFFYTIYDRKTHTQSYKLSLIECISNTIPKLNTVDLHLFLDKLISLYESHLSLTIKSDPTIDALFQLLVKSNHDVMNRVIANQETILQYLNTLCSAVVPIDDSDIATYHSTCANEFGLIRFTGISGAENRQHLRLNDFYVETSLSYGLNNFHSDYSLRSDKLPSISIGQIFDVSNKVVILGGAGLGKTTTLNYVYCNYENLFQPCKIKIKIDLKQYVKEICENNKDILSCISLDFYKKIKRKNANIETISVLLSDLLSQGSCLIIFDALDEIASQPARNKVRDEISNFTTIYYLNRYIISSRETGYLRNNFDNSFLHLRINEFGETQIRQYSKNWFNNNNGSDFVNFWKRFTAEVSRARCEDLIRNPIILILALIIFDIENNLPNKRVEFYEKCIDTFLSIREDRKAAFPLSDKAKNILSSDCVVPQIAQYKFSHAEADLDYKFSESELNSAVFEAIDVPDQINWNTAVREYTTYLVERTELIQEVNENELDFAHKTFFEYFLAVYYVKELEDDKLIDLLSSWIGDANFDELARLIIEVIIKNNNSRQHRRIMDFLFSSIENSHDVRDSLAVDTLIILSELYSHNMLLPKFHKRFFLCILFNPFFVWDAEMAQIGRAQNQPKISYDSTILAQLFAEIITNDGNMARVLDSLYVLDGNFQDEVVGLVPDSPCERIVTLFRQSSGRIKINSSIKRTFEFFISEDGFPLVVTYPQIYLSLLKIMARMENFDRIDIFAISEHESNSLFMKYTNPDTFSYLVRLASISCTGLVILLNSIVNCAYGKTNFLFRFFVNQHRKNSTKDYRLAASFICKLWNSLDSALSYQDFIVSLEAINLYDPLYDAQLNKLFIMYQEREKDIEYLRTKTLINRIYKETLDSADKTA